MVFYEILQSLGQTFDLDLVRSWMVGVKVGAGALTGTMGDGLYSASWGGTLPGVGKLAYCDPSTPSRRLVQVVGSGSSGDRSWDIWRITDWGDLRQPLNAADREQKKARADFLREQLHRWDVEYAANPGARHRDVSAQREELKSLDWILAPIGSLFSVAYVGYGRRWHAITYVLSGPGGEWGKPDKPPVTVHCWKTTYWTYCGLQRAGTVIGVYGWRGYLLGIGVVKEYRCSGCLGAIVREEGPI